MGYSAATLYSEKTDGQNSDNKRLMPDSPNNSCATPQTAKGQKKQSRCGSLSVSLSNGKKQVRSNTQHLYPLARIKIGCAATIKLQKGLAGNLTSTGLAGVGLHSMTAGIAMWAYGRLSWVQNNCRLNPVPIGLS